MVYVVEESGSYRTLKLVVDRNSVACLVKILR